MPFFVASWVYLKKNWLLSGLVNLIGKTNFLSASVFPLGGKSGS